MSSINTHVGKMIRKYRKAANLTLQQLADAIHKSRATICKYENGDISIDIETLYEISQVLQVSVPQLTDIGRLQAEADHSSAYAARKSPFFQAKMLYFYFYDGRYNRMKDGVINIHEKEENGSYRATLSICSVSGNGRSSESYYNGSVLYSDMLIRFSFVNQYNPLEFRTHTDGLLCGISSADLMPCAFKCLVALEKQELNEELRKHLLFTKTELQRWKKLNMLLIDNYETGSRQV